MNNNIRLKRLNELEYMLLNHKKIFGEMGIGFNLSNWAEKACDFAAARFFNKKFAEKVSAKNLCGSAACALGSAAIYPPFTKQGLTLISDGVSSEQEEIDGVSQFKYEANFAPSYKGDIGEYAGAEFFQITVEESRQLFMPDEYLKDNPTAKDVAKRVRELINQYSE